MPKNKTDQKKERMVGRTIRFPESMLETAEKRAANEERSLGALVRQAVSKHIRRSA